MYVKGSLIGFDEEIPDDYGIAASGDVAESTEARIDTPKQDGENVTGPCSWANWARVAMDPDEDAIHFGVSIDDPRGALGITIRRLPDGRLIIHLPRPDDGMPHVELRELHPGTLEVGHWHDCGKIGSAHAHPDSASGPIMRGDGRVWYWSPRSFEDEEPEWVDAASRLTRERCTELLESTGTEVFDGEPIEDLREAVVEQCKGGDIEESDIA